MIDFHRDQCYNIHNSVIHLFPKPFPPDLAQEIIQDAVGTYLETHEMTAYLVSPLLHPDKPAYAKGLYDFLGDSFVGLAAGGAVLSAAASYEERKIIDALLKNQKSICMRSLPT